MTPLHLVTPYLPHRGLPQSLTTDGRRVFVKMDSGQPTGSFKIRGIGRLCQQLRAEGAAGFVCSSGGNAGYAAAYAGQALGVPVTVVVPSTTPAFMRDRIASLGAEVIVEGDVWDEADALARQLVAKSAAEYVSPFDHPLLWDGHAGLIDEIAAQGPAPDAVVVAVGGGGLMCGIAEGLERNGLTQTAILAVETEGASCLAQSMAAGELVTLGRIDTIASSLGARRVADAAFAWTGRRPVVPVVVSDADAVRACARFADDHLALVEPACGAALSVAYDAHPALEPYRTIAVIACGGVVVSLEKLAAWRAQFGV
ncbi:pyridoxal-phosphate dependent enzyme [Phenylobacterium sp.]|uniref:pyridoxal-phosphate dependent enzyme n=1 Tax=Phenylobacterium sp. TaxID=1871053 RepID=UPI0012065D58|nr:pyridoxal-phosphate dependent enzyme [Phenylobacterium sp.]THD64708.1 MAG: pyridoxal-phosphate dependent enzyme [Phenylobacterium sp.]